MPSNLSTGGSETRSALLVDAHHRRCTAYTAEQGVGEKEAITRGLEEKAKEFVKSGEVYQKAMGLSRNGGDDTVLQRRGSI